MKTNTERLIETFGRHTRLFIPVIHHASVEGSFQAVRVARGAGLKPRARSPNLTIRHLV